jgi:5-methylcytosine-specific restriction endonuclease McrA
MNGSRVKSFIPAKATKSVAIKSMATKAAAAGSKTPTSVAKAPTSVAKAPTSVAKAPIPKALREQVWVVYAGRCFERKCLVPWCQNNMTVFDFHVGHDVPESEGGATQLRNLRPICARCNLSMGAQYSIQEWSQISHPVPAHPPAPLPWYQRVLAWCR